MQDETQKTIKNGKVSCKVRVFISYPICLSHRFPFGEREGVRGNAPLFWCV
jgi:hypothetical protein